MAIIKPLQLGLIGRAQREPPKVYFFVTALGYFDLLDPADFDLETRMWPAVTPALGASPLDPGMPKPRGEVVVIGDAVAPGARPVTQMAVEISVGPVRKALAVFGDRHWELTDDGPVFTTPAPFERMPVVWERAFGGPGFAENPAGAGFGARAALAEGRPARLPNIEDPASPILSVEHTPRPVGFAPIDVMAPARQRYAGTYDEAWLRRHHPGHAVDFDWTFYHSAAPDQRAPGFFTGNEPIRILGMHAEHPEIGSRLPGMRVRAFLNRDEGGGPALTETPMRCETVVLFPGPLKGVVIYRGGCEIGDIDGKDVADTMLAYERLDDPPRPFDHYARTFEERSDPENAALAFFDQSSLRPDVPKSERAEREAERTALAAEREDRRVRRMELMFAQAYEAAGAPPPPAGAIPIPSPPVPMPVITPGDVERMEVDMKAVSEAMGRLRAYGEARLAEAREQGAVLLNELASLLDGPGTPMIDAAGAARLRAAAATLPPPPDTTAPILPEAVPTLDSIREELVRTGALREGEDPFEEAVAALRAARAPDGPLADSEKSVLRARAEGRPEGRMTAPLLDHIDDTDPTAGGVAEPLPAEATGAAGESMAAFLDRLGLDESAGDAMRGLGSALEELGPQAGLVTSLMAADPPHPPVPGPEEALAQARTAAHDAAEQLETAFVKGRRLCSSPMAPLDPLRPEAARFLGEAVRACLAGGGDLTGRDWAGAALAGVDFSGRDLRGAMFERADLAGADFRGALLEDAVFAGTALAGADLSGCRMARANLSNADGRPARGSPARTSPKPDCSKRDSPGPTCRMSRSRTRSH